MMNTGWVRLLEVTGAAVLMGCDGSRPPMSAKESVDAQRLSGIWDMRFHLIRSPLIALDTSSVPRAIQGKLSLLVNTSLNRSFPGMGIPTDYGSYDVDLTPFGFDTRVSGKTPTAIVGWISGDSVEIILGPEGEAGELFLVGRLEDNVVTGIWTVMLPSSGGEGTFVFKRVAARGAK